MPGEERDAARASLSFYHVLSYAEKVELAFGVLESGVRRQLEKTPGNVDPDVVRLKADIITDQFGLDALLVLVILRDSFALTPPSPSIGQRLERIALRLRQRAMQAGLPLYAFVDFVRESEAAR